MNTVTRPQLGYMKGEEFVDQFNKENSAPWNQYSRKRLRGKQGKQVTATCLMCCLNSVPLLFTSPHFIYSVANSTAVFKGPVDTSRRDSHRLAYPVALGWKSGGGKPQLRISGENYLYTEGRRLDFIHFRPAVITCIC